MRVEAATRGEAVVDLTKEAATTSVEVVGVIINEEGEVLRERATTRDTWAVLVALEGFTSAAQDKNLWVHLVQFLKKSSLLPACIFVFSKKRCEENADALSNQDFSTAQEKSHIHMIVEKSLARLKPEDRVLPQVIRMKELLSRGIAVHHGGLLPIVKELVEILFAQTLVKVLFATETFAMGLNLPTRTSCFLRLQKA